MTRNIVTFVLLFSIQNVAFGNEVKSGSISGPRSSLGVYRLSWPGGGTEEYFTLQEKLENQKWRTLIDQDRIHEKYFGNKRSGTYHYRLKECFRFDGHGPLECLDWSDVHTVQVNNPSRFTVTVALGDSFVSGEGGRWQGNFSHNVNVATDHYNMSDRGALRVPHPGSTDTETIARTIYGDTVDNLCNRSDMPAASRMRNAYRGTTEFLNYACSGAETKDIRYSYYKNEKPQIRNLYDANELNEIKYVNLGVGGNDFGFTTTIVQCVASRLRTDGQIHALHDILKIIFTGEGIPRNCAPYFTEQFSSLDETNNIAGKVLSTVQKIQQEMESLGYGHYSERNYRIVLQGYPSIVPDEHDWRVVNDDYISGCPLNRNEMTIVNRELIPKLNGILEAVADRAKVDFVNPENALRGHRLCEE